MEPVSQSISPMPTYEIALYLMLALLGLGVITALVRSAEFRRDVALTLLLIGVIIIGVRSMSTSLGLMPGTIQSDLPTAGAHPFSVIVYVAGALIGLSLVVGLIRSAQFRRDAILFLLLGGLATAGIAFVANGLGLQTGTLSIVLIAAFIVIYIRKTWLY